MTNYYTMSWTCHDGSLARVVIPSTADDDDLKAIREFYDVIARRHFKAGDILRKEGKQDDTQI